VCHRCVQKGPANALALVFGAHIHAHHVGLVPRFGPIIEFKHHAAHQYVSVKRAKGHAQALWVCQPPDPKARWRGGTFLRRGRERVGHLVSLQHQGPVGRGIGFGQAGNGKGHVAMVE